MKVVGWKVWYIGGSVYSSRDVKWADLPDDGVLFVQLYFDKRGNRSKLPYRRRFGSEDYYWHIVGTEVWGSCRHEEMTPGEIRLRYPGASIKRGRWTSEDEYLRTERKVTLDYGQ